VRELPRYFVAGTDTGVGKTEVAAALLSLMADAGLAPGALKPYESGCQDVEAPSDALALREAARSDDALGSMSLHRFRASLAPGVAAERLGLNPSWTETLKAFRAFQGRALVVEGAGGLLVPLDRRHQVIDFIAATRLPVVLVGRAGLGTLNHTGLSLLALRARHLRIRAVVLVRTSSARDPSIRDNARWLQRRDDVEVLGPIPFIPDAVERRAAFRRQLRPLVLSSH
jgi:dethiobiotin synthetase